MPRVATLEEVVEFCNEYLKISSIEDYPQAHNGLQFENDGVVKTIGAAVDFNMQSIERAIQNNVDMLFVHHGMFWNEAVPVTGLVHKKYKMLINANIAVYSAHLPIDVHDEIGNNASILKLLCLKRVSSVSNSHFDLPIAAANYDRKELHARILKNFPRTIAIEYGPLELGKVAVCSGGGGSEMWNMIKSGAQTIILGEAQRHHFDIALENNVNMYVCGHYDTETFGIKNLSQVVAKKFGLKNIWIKEDCVL